MNACAPNLEKNDVEQLIHHYLDTRKTFLNLCAPLQTDDYNLQAEPFTSPPKWHLAHTSWFFETFILKVYAPDYTTLNPSYEMLFNSYYNGIGEQFPRAKRGLLSRPSLEDVLSYREKIDQSMLQLLNQLPEQHFIEILKRTRLGIEHEQQHQELFYTDIKYSLSINPLQPRLLEQSPEFSTNPFEQTQTPVIKSQPIGKKDHCDERITPHAASWATYSGGLFELGINGSQDAEAGFCFDNEMPKHKVYLEAFALAKTLVSFDDFKQFVEAGGYQKPELWLADGWAWIQAEQISCPLYWQKTDDHWQYYSLQGLVRLPTDSPICHINAYEADAFARWQKCRLPTEAEWEYAATQHDVDHLFDHRWQWTGSSYRPYPGYQQAEGAIGEYNGKFMSNQWVLRGSSCVTAKGHSRSTYRNFFYPHERWQFTGLRLAKTLS